MSRAQVQTRAVAVAQKGWVARMTHPGMTPGTAEKGGA